MKAIVNHVKVVREIIEHIKRYFLAKLKPLSESKGQLVPLFGSIDLPAV